MKMHLPCLLSCFLRGGGYDTHMMRHVLGFLLCHAVWTFGCLGGSAMAAEEEKKPEIALAETERLRELDAYWNRVSQAVRQGDFESYRQTCHPLGVLVSGNKRMSQPLTAALARWKQEFVDTQSGAMKAQVDFRFSRRMGDATTAHETGIFRYESQRKGEEPKVEFVRLEALLLKENGRWQIMMEHQRESATEADWQALK